MTTIDPWNRSCAEAAGFAGFAEAGALRLSRCKEIPSTPGCYVVVREAEEAPAFLPASVGGWFKGKNPTVGVDVLNSRWLPETTVVYLGMASKNLRVRVRALVDYGGGKPVGHQGGRFLWQMEGCSSLLVGWRDDPDASALESRLLAEFELVHGQLPFANLRH